MTDGVEVDGDVVRLTGAGTVRALAHPARLRVIDELYAGDIERTATELAEVCGLTPSAMSYHLRALEKAGLLVRAEGRGDGRERPWRGRGRVISVTRDGAGSTESDLLHTLSFDRTREMHEAWTSYSRKHPDARERTRTLSTGKLRLTLSEAQELSLVVQQACDSYLEASFQRAEDPDDDTDRYAYSWNLFPDVEGLRGD